LLELCYAAVTLLLSRAIILKAASEPLRHSQVGIALDQYSHVLPSTQRNATAAKERVLLRRSRDRSAPFRLG
jgi:hypothetical protein